MTETRDDAPDAADDALTHFTGTGTLRSKRHYDPDDGDLTTAIVGAVADAEGVELSAVTEPLLYESIDAAALEGSLFATGDRPGFGDYGEVEFQYHGYVVTVDSDGWIAVCEQSHD